MAGACLLCWLRRGRGIWRGGTWLVKRREGEVGDRAAAWLGKDTEPCRKSPKKEEV